MSAWPLPGLFFLWDLIATIWIIISFLNLSQKRTHSEKKRAIALDVIERRAKKYNIGFVKIE
ncbi:hypothetical protein [Gloeothece citriformis]|uniref:hypothetical protein n=1 Tax=Gloeothece citriformis TaxID=2546356 RepID=UPI00059D3244|nr:hypothetical protein [Gloeothece citriformis]